MAKLKECKDCGHPVSKSADACPNCGRRYKRRWNEIGPFTSLLIFGFILLFILSSYSSEASEHTTTIPVYYTGIEANGNGFLVP